MGIQDWKYSGNFLEVEGIKIYFRDSGGPKPVLCILHGYPTSSYDYQHLLPELSENFRVILHDQAGFGLSGKPINYGYQLKDQAKIALKLWERLGVNKAHIMAHDYGTSVATEIMALRLDGYNSIEFESLTLCNGSVHIELSQLRTIQKLLKHPLLGSLVALVSNRNTFRRNMRNIWYDDSGLTNQQLDLMWELLTVNHGKRVLPKITRYIDQRYEFYDRWIGALKKTDLPSHILWAKNDPVAVIDIAYALKEDIPHAKLTILDNLGHYPMIEDPVRWKKCLMDFYQNLNS